MARNPIEYKKWASLEDAFNQPSKAIPHRREQNFQDIFYFSYYESRMSQYSYLPSFRNEQTVESIVYSSANYKAARALVAKSVPYSDEVDDLLQKNLHNSIFCSPYDFEISDKSLREANGNMVAFKPQTITQLAISRTISDMQHETELSRLFQKQAALFIDDNHCADFFVPRHHPVPTSMVNRQSHRESENTRDDNLRVFPDPNW